jgi:hypothetical protein
LLEPVSESQLRPLQRLETPETRRHAWAAAVEKAGGQPTAVEVAHVVRETLAQQAPPEIPPEIRQTRSQQRLDLVGRLKAVIKQHPSWEDAEALLTELEALL